MLIISISLHLLIFLILLKYMSIIHSNARIIRLRKANRVNEWIRIKRKNQTRGSFLISRSSARKGNIQRQQLDYFSKKYIAFIIFLSLTHTLVLNICFAHTVSYGKNRVFSIYYIYYMSWGVVRNCLKSKLARSLKYQFIHLNYVLFQ